MHVLATGAAGYIGSHTVLELLNANYTITAIDNFSNSFSDKNGDAISLARVSELTGKEIIFKKVDILNVTELECVFQSDSFDAVIHFAAFKSVGESTEKPLEYYNNNVVGSINLITLCKKYGVKNFIFSSSCTVYGSADKLPIKDDTASGIGITNPYGRSKHIVEQVLMDMTRFDTNWNIISLRYFNPVGAHQSGKIGEDPKGAHTNLMPFVSQVAVGKHPFVKIFGNDYDTPDGTGIRDYIHVVDLARGHVAALDRIKKCGHIGHEVYNLGTGKGYSVLEIIAAFEKISGQKIPVKISARRLGDVASAYCSPDLAFKKLGWKAEFGLDEMCASSWKWQQQNPDGYLIDINNNNVQKL